MAARDHAASPLGEAVASAAAVAAVEEGDGEIMTARRGSVAEEDGEVTAERVAERVAVEDEEVVFCRLRNLGCLFAAKEATRIANRRAARWTLTGRAMTWRWRSEWRSTSSTTTNTTTASTAGACHLLTIVHVFTPHLRCFTLFTITEATTLIAA
jgi:hypothetical protein